MLGHEIVVRRIVLNVKREQRVQRELVELVLVAVDLGLGLEQCMVMFFFFQEQGGDQVLVKALVLVLAQALVVGVWVSLA